MDNSQWKLLKKRLMDELPTLLAPLEECDWNKETSRKANIILSRRAFDLIGLLDLPKIPVGHRMFAKMWFKASKPDDDGKTRNEQCLSIYHVPWTRGRSRQTGAPRRRVIATALKPEDPLGLLNRVYTATQTENELERAHYRFHEASEFLMSPPLQLADVYDGHIVEASPQ